MLHLTALHIYTGFHWEVEVWQGKEIRYVRPHLVSRDCFTSALLLVAPNDDQVSLICDVIFPFRLAAHMAGYKCFQIELTRGYDYAAFREDLKQLYYSAGLDRKHTVFLFTDTQVIHPFLPSNH